MDDGHKDTCHFIVSQRDEWMQTTIIPTMKESTTVVKSSGKATTTTVDTVGSVSASAKPLCGICLEEEIRSPTVLSKCGHVFCFACLATFQGHLTPDDLLESGRILQVFKRPCPYCRVKMETNVVADALDKATAYLDHTTRLLDTEVEERNDIYRLASVEVEKVLAMDPIYLSARNHKARILIHQDPVQAIQYIHETFQVERTESEKLELFILGWTRFKPLVYWDNLSSIGG